MKIATRNLSVLAALLSTLAFAENTPSVVKLVKNGDAWQLTRNGESYFIKGAGGDGSKKMLAECGGNSFRTWSDDHLESKLDEAQKHGLSVTVGFWLGQERQGFNYNNVKAVADQYDHVVRAVEKFKNHPAVLLWAIGNEMEGGGDNAAVWSAINNMASAIKKIDPNHPTMTVVAEIGGSKVKNFHRLCPDVDVLGINSYAGIASVPERYRKAGGTKPYIITEFGPPGIWEQKKNAIGAYEELTSTGKTDIYRKAYESAVSGEKNLCIGSYVFLWGQKQEVTATWFSLFLPDGTRTGVVDAMSELWGKPVPNRAPKIENFSLSTHEVEPGATIQATLASSDPENDQLKVKWSLLGDAETFGSGGDFEKNAEGFADAVVKSDNQSAEIKLPAGGGLYRVFATVHDDHGGAAVANIPVRVKGAVIVPLGKKATLPLVLFDEKERADLPYQPAGWMGNTQGMKVDVECAENPHSGKTCVRVDYTETTGWAGVVMQNPAQDWGDRAGGWDLSGAKKLTFWARGESGDEVVTFEFGIINKNKKFFDTASGKLDKTKLTKEWQQFSIDLAGKDLTRIKTGFVWVVAASGKPMTFYVDDILYE